MKAGTLSAKKMKKRKKIVQVFTLILICLLITLSCNDDNKVIPNNPISETSPIDIIGPIFIDEIEGGYWQNDNHAQGICFTDNSLIISRANH